jgi:hypothetical protein
LTVPDIKERKELSIPMMVLSITSVSKLAVGFMTGISLACVLKAKGSNP